MRRALLSLTLTLAAAAVVQASTSTETLYLSGRGPDDAVPWQFRCDSGRGCGEWTTIPVPSNWELEGFLTYDYGRFDDKTADSGRYRVDFHLPAAWKHRNVDLVFGAVMTDTEVTVNGRSAGLKHQGGFYEFRYDVTELLRIPGRNRLEVTVDEHSANESVNRAERDADYWTFGGIYRPVRLEARPTSHLRELAVDARGDGTLSVSATAVGAISGGEVVAAVTPLEPGREPLGELRGTIGSDGAARLSGRIDGVRPWSAEWPHLYRLTVTLVRDGSTVHQEHQRIGFRTIEARPGDGLHVNGHRVRLKGINRHAFWPDSGRTLSAAMSRLDVAMLKSMNVNAVRASHYPPDEHFLDACDEAGLYVLDELAGWHDAYDTDVGEQLVREMVTRDRNHPSIILWANGNEGGFNPELDDDFHRWDPQRRPVLHPDEREALFDTRHYPTWAEWESMLGGGGFDGWLDGILDRPQPLVLATEALHGLYDGGHGAGLAAYWERLLEAPTGVGLFLWAFLDEGVVRTDRGGEIDTAGNLAPDGVVGPYREPEGSVRAIREVFSPVTLDPGEPAGGVLPVGLTNRYDMTSLDQVALRWTWLELPGPLDPAVERTLGQGSIVPRATLPGNTTTIEVPLTDAPNETNAVRLDVVGPDGGVVHDRVVRLRPISWQPKALLAPPRLTRSGAVWHLGCDDVEVVVADDGRIEQLRAGSTVFPLRGGPVALADSRHPSSVGPAPDSDSTLRVEGAGALERLDVSCLGDRSLGFAYRLRLEPDQARGLGFELSPTSVTGVEWVGRGPYRVWGNRMAGRIGVWSGQTNDTITGQSWEYPEFRGYRGDVDWIRLETTAGPIVVIPGSALPHALVVRPTAWSAPEEAVAELPNFDFAIVDHVPPIGTKFYPAEEIGAAVPTKATVAGSFAITLPRSDG